MKIIGHTRYGYLIEIDPKEIAKITGVGTDDKHLWYGENRYGSGSSAASHPIGTEFHVGKTWDHLQNLLSNEKDRQKIAESLRAAATLIEHTPSPITIPIPAEESARKETAQ